MNQQDFEDAFALMLSGAAEITEKGIKWKDECGYECYISFPTLTPNEAIVTQLRTVEIFTLVEEHWFRDEYHNGIKINEQPRF